MHSQEADTLQKFIFENSNVRGDLIHLRASYQVARERYDYPPVVAEQLGQALAVATLLGSTIKFDGSLIMQIQAAGPVNLLVAQVTHDRHIRGLARWAEVPPEQGTLDTIYGDGQITITIAANRFEDRYQGIVGLSGDTLADAIGAYFEQSEQIKTHMWLVADQEQVVGMLLQKLPGDDPDPDLWQRVEMLGSTVTAEELFQLSSAQILQRLFHEEDVRLFDPEPVSFRCSCSRDKVGAMIRGLGIDEARDIVKHEDEIKVGCEFCNRQHVFDAVDVEALFASSH